MAEVSTPQAIASPSFQAMPFPGLSNIERPGPERSLMIGKPYSMRSSRASMRGLRIWMGGLCRHRAAAQFGVAPSTSWDGICVLLLIGRSTS